jgi:hypothetical protein
VDQQAAQYRIRLARQDELPRLREIEDRAGSMSPAWASLKRHSTSRSHLKI